MKNYLIGWIGGSCLTFAMMFGVALPNATQRAADETHQMWEEALQDYDLCLPYEDEEEV